MHFALKGAEGVKFRAGDSKESDAPGGWIELHCKSSTTVQVVNRNRNLGYYSRVKWCQDPPGSRDPGIPAGASRNQR